MENYGLQKQIQDLLYASIRAHNIRQNDAVSLKTLKLILLGQVLEGLGLDWTYLLNLFKTHTPVHPDLVKELESDEEINCTLAQVFVRNDKLVRLLKTLSQQGKNIHRLLAIDGLGGPNGHTFDPKHYIGNLRYAHSKHVFDLGPESKRLHIQTVRDLYDRLEKVPAPEKQIYEIVRMSFDEMGRVKLPALELEAEERMDVQLQGEAGRFYMKAMGQENIMQVIKSMGLKRFRGEKRTQTEREEKEEEEDESEKR